MKIRIIAPITSSEIVSKTIPVLRKYICGNTQISLVNILKGPASLESIYEETLAAPQVAQRVLEAERDGMDAIVIDCMNDPGLEAAREITRIPVIGAAQSAMTLAAILCNKFSIIATAKRDRFPFELLIKRYGLIEKYTSTRSVEIPVLELHDNPEKLLSSLFVESVHAIQEDGASGIIFGCTRMRDMKQDLKDALQQHGLNPLIIDPSSAALKWAEMTAGLNLTQSLKTYPYGKSFLLPDHQNLNTEFTPSWNGLLNEAVKICVMVPVIQGYRGNNWLEETQKGYAAYARPTTQITVEAIQTGPATIENQYQKAMCIPELLLIAKKAEREGADALIIDCMSDPGFDAVREAVSIPVIGQTQACSFLASALSHRFSILGTRKDYAHKFTNQVAEYGISSRLASVRTVGLTVEEVETNPERLLKALLDAGELAVVQDGAHSLIPGCTGMIGLADALQEGLSERGIHVPVLEPPAVAVKLAELLTDLHLTHSKITWPLPPEKEISGYPISES
ncbi:aspartate/glutamate racemase family protein [Flexilinea flocculi]|uniref:Asp/Glu/hydantoin racemase n=1 Tax=Flexilinea flocculi TaxID=1678840 RepID=A0A0S7BIC1_9CHLR|nr:aspartate/glutamate racemase family protein [Flexilinea flocculi]GAP40133.1 Asp/Glu/hydantoin racemase [Flexilinea flocculi]